MENAQLTTTTTDGQALALVLQDQAGNYFVLPQAALERGRVVREHKAYVERLIAAGGGGGPGGDDVQGHTSNPLVVVAVVQQAAVAEVLRGVLSVFGLSAPSR